MNETKKAPRTEYHMINLRKDSDQRKRFRDAHEAYRLETGDRPTQGEFLMILLGQWERRKEVV